LERLWHSSWRWQRSAVSRNRKRELLGKRKQLKQQMGRQQRRLGTIWQLKLVRFHANTMQQTRTYRRRLTKSHFPKRLPRHSDANLRIRLNRKQLQKWKVTTISICHQPPPPRPQQIPTRLLMRRRLLQRREQHVRSHWQKCSSSLIWMILERLKPKSC